MRFSRFLTIAVILQLVFAGPLFAQSVTPTDPAGTPAVDPAAGSAATTPTPAAPSTTFTDTHTVIDSQSLQSLSSLTVGTGQTVVIDFSQQGTLSLPGNITNSGSIYAVSTNQAVSNANISSANVFNQQGGLFTTVLPTGGLSGLSGLLSNFSLSLFAAQDVVNAGIISSAGNLNVTAGGTITNALPAGVTGMQPVMQAMQDLNLIAGAGGIVNSGLMQSMAGNININTLVPTDLLIGNIGGRMEAILGNINVRDQLFTGNNSLTMIGGDYIAQAMNLYSGGGAVNINAQEIRSLINIGAHESHVLVSAGNLSLGNVCLTGDPTFYNNSGGISIDGDITVNEALTIIASGDITTTTGTPAYTLRAANVSKGFDITLIAGANFTSVPGAGSGSVGPYPGTGTSASGPVTINGASPSGGSILLSNRVINIDASAPVSGQQGGNVTLVAYSGTGGGQVLLKSDSVINTSGFGAGTNGSVTIIGSYDTSSGAAVSTGFINTTGGAGNGAITIAAAAPKLFGGTSLTFDTTGAVDPSSLASKIVPDYTQMKSGRVDVLGGITGSGAVDIRSGGNIVLDMTTPVLSGSSLFMQSMGDGAGTFGDIQFVGATRTYNANFAGGAITMLAGRNIAPGTATTTLSITGNDVTLVAGAFMNNAADGSTVIDFGNTSRSGSINANLGTLTVNATGNAKIAANANGTGGVIVMSPGTVNGNLTVVSGKNDTSGAPGIYFQGAGTMFVGGNATLSVAQPIGMMSFTPQGQTANEISIGGLRVGRLAIAATTTALSNATARTGGQFDVSAGRIFSGSGTEIEANAAYNAGSISGGTFVHISGVGPSNLFTNNGGGVLISGGQIGIDAIWVTNQSSIQATSGSIGINSESLTNNGSVSAANIALNNDNGALNITGTGTFASTSSLTLGASGGIELGNTAGGVGLFSTRFSSPNNDILIISKSDVTASGGIVATQYTNGGDISIVAGANYSYDPIVNPSLVTISGQFGAGGSITLNVGGSTVFFDSSSSGTGGAVSMVAYSGAVSLASSSTIPSIKTGGVGSLAAGAVRLIGGTSTGAAIRVGTIEAVGSISGSISLIAGNPSLAPTYTNAQASSSFIVGPAQMTDATVFVGTAGNTTYVKGQTIIINAGVVNVQGTTQLEATTGAINIIGPIATTTSNGLQLNLSSTTTFDSLTTVSATSQAAGKTLLINGRLDVDGSLALSSQGSITVGSSAVVTANNITMLTETLNLSANSSATALLGQLVVNGPATVAGSNGLSISAGTNSLLGGATGVSLASVASGKDLRVTGSLHVDGALSIASQGGVYATGANYINNDFIQIVATGAVDVLVKDTASGVTIHDSNSLTDNFTVTVFGPAPSGPMLNVENTGAALTLSIDATSPLSGPGSVNLDGNIYGGVVDVTAGNSITLYSGADVQGNVSVTLEAPQIVINGSVISVSGPVSLLGEGTNLDVDAALGSVSGATVAVGSTLFMGSVNATFGSLSGAVQGLVLDGDYHIESASPLHISSIEAGEIDIVADQVILENPIASRSLFATLGEVTITNRTNAGLSVTQAGTLGVYKVIDSALGISLNVGVGQGPLTVSGLFSTKGDVELNGADGVIFNGDWISNDASNITVTTSGPGGVDGSGPGNSQFQTGGIVTFNGDNGMIREIMVGALGGTVFNTNGDVVDVVLTLSENDITGHVGTANLSTAGSLRADAFNAVGNITLFAGDNMTVGGIKSNSGTVDLTAIGGIDMVHHIEGTTVKLSAPVVTYGVGVLTATTLEFRSGTSASGLETHVSNIVFSNAGNVQLDNTQSAPLNLSGTAGTLDVETDGDIVTTVLLKAAGGDLSLTANFAGKIDAGQVLEATGSLNLSTNTGAITQNGAGHFRAGSDINLQSSTGAISRASNTPLSTDAPAISANTTGVVNIGNTTSTQLNASSGSNFTLTSNGSLTVADGVEGNSITLKAFSGPVLLEADVDGNSSVLIEATGAGSITQSSGVVSGTAVELKTAGGDIGQPSPGSPIQIATSNLKLITAGSAYVHNTGDVTLNSLTNVGNQLNLTVGGTLTTVGPLTANNIALSTAPDYNIIIGSSIAANPGGQISLATQGSGFIHQNAGTLAADTIDLSSGAGTIDGVTNGSYLATQSTGTIYIDSNGTVKIQNDAGGFTAVTIDGHAGNADIWVNGNVVVGDLTVSGGLNLGSTQSIGQSLGTVLTADSLYLSTMGSGVVNLHTAVGGVGGINLSTPGSDVQIDNDGALQLLTGSAKSGDVRTLDASDLADMTVGTLFVTDGFMLIANGNVNVAGQVTTGGDLVISTAAPSKVLTVSDAIVVNGGNDLSLNARTINLGADITVASGTVSMTGTAGGLTLELDAPIVNITATSTTISTTSSPLVIGSTPGSEKIHTLGNLSVLVNTTPASININQDLDSNGSITISGSGADVRANLTAGTSINVTGTTGAINGFYASGFDWTANSISVQTTSGDIQNLKADAPVVSLTTTALSGKIGTAADEIEIKAGAQVNISSAGAAYIQGLGNLTVSGATATAQVLDIRANGTITTTGVVSAGEVTLASTATNGSILLGANLTGVGEATLIAKGTGTISQGGGTIYSNDLTLSSQLGAVGSSGTNLQTSAASIAANSSGDVYIHNAGPTVLGPSTGDDLWVTTTGDLTLNGIISATNLKLTASGVGSDIIHQSGSLSSSVVGTLSAGGNIGDIIHPVIINSPFTVNSGASSYVAGVGDVTVNATTIAGDLYVATVGNIYTTGVLQADRVYLHTLTGNYNVVIGDDITANTLVDIVSNGSGSITQAAGAVLSGTTINLDSGSGSIGTGAQAIHTSHTGLHAVNVSTAGSVNLVDDGPAAIVSGTMASGSVSGVSLTALNLSAIDGDLTISATTNLSVSDVTASGALVLNSNNSLLSLNNLVIGTDSVVLNSGTGLISQPVGVNNVVSTMGTLTVTGVVSSGGYINTDALSVVVNSTGLMNINDIGIAMQLTGTAGTGTFTVSTGSLTVTDFTATNGPLTLRAGGDVTVASGVNPNSVSVTTGNLMLQSTGAGGDVYIDGSVSSNATVYIQANIAGDGTISQSAGNISAATLDLMSGIGNIDITSTSAGNIHVATDGTATVTTSNSLVNLTAGGSHVVLSDSFAGPVTLSGVIGSGAVTANGIIIGVPNFVADTGALTIASTTGDIQVSHALSAVGDLTVDSARHLGSLAAGTISSSTGAVLLESSGTNVSITTNGAVNAATSATLQGTGTNVSVAVNGGIVAPSVTLTATGTGTISQSGPPISTSSLTLNSNTGAISGIFTNAGSIDITSSATASITATNGNIVFDSNTNTIVTATNVSGVLVSGNVGSGSISSTAGLTASGLDATAGNLTLQTANNMTITGPVSATGTLSLLSTVVDRTIDINDDISANAIVLDTKGNGTIIQSIGTITANSLQLNSGTLSGASATLTYIAVPVVTINSPGDVYIRDTFSGNVSFNTSGVTLQSLYFESNSPVANMLTATGAINSNGFVQIGAINGVLNVTGSINAQGLVNLAGSMGVTTGSVTSFVDDILIDALSGNISTGFLTAGNDVTVSADAGAISTSTIQAVGAVDLSATGGVLVTGSVTSSSDNVGISGGGMTITGNVAASGTATFSSTNGAALLVGGTVDPSGNLILNAPTSGVLTTDASGISIGTTGAVILHTTASSVAVSGNAASVVLSADNVLTVTGALSSTATVGGGLTLSAGTDLIVSAPLSIASGVMSLTAGGDMTLGNPVNATSGSFSASAGGILNVNGLVTMPTGSVTLSGGQVNLNNNIFAGTATPGINTDMNAITSLVGGGIQITSLGSVVLANNIRLQSAGNNISISTNNGSITGNGAVLYAQGASVFLQSSGAGYGITFTDLDITAVAASGAGPYGYVGGGIGLYAGPTPGDPAGAVLALQASRTPAGVTDLGSTTPAGTVQNINGSSIVFVGTNGLGDVLANGGVIWIDPVSLGAGSSISVFGPADVGGSTGGTTPTTTTTTATTTTTGGGGLILPVLIADATIAADSGTVTGGGSGTILSVDVTGPPSTLVLAPMFAPPAPPPAVTIDLGGTTGGAATLSASASAGGASGGGSSGGSGGGSGGTSGSAAGGSASGSSGASASSDGKADATNSASAASQANQGDWDVPQTQYIVVSPCQQYLIQDRDAYGTLSSTVVASAGTMLSAPQRGAPTELAARTLALKTGKMVIVAGQKQGMRVRVANGTVDLPAQSISIIEQRPSGTTRVALVSGNGAARINLNNGASSESLSANAGEEIVLGDDAQDEEFIPADGVDRQVVSANIMLASKSAVDGALYGTGSSSNVRISQQKLRAQKSKFSQDQMNKQEKLLSPCYQDREYNKPKQNAGGGNVSSHLQAIASVMPQIAKPNPASAAGSVGVATTTIQMNNGLLKHTAGAEVSVDKDNVVNLKNGELLVWSQRPTVVKSGNALVHVAENTMALVRANNQALAVRCILDAHSNSLRLGVGKFSVNLTPGQEGLVVHDSVMPVSVLKSDGVARRSVRSFEASKSENVVVSDVSFLSLLQTSALLRSINKSADPVDQAIKGKILKTAVALTVVTGRKGPYAHLKD